MNIDELKEYCEGEFSNIDRIREELSATYKQEKTEYTLSEQAAIAALVINIYTGIEKILKKMLIYDKLDIKDSPEWHEKVLKKSGEIGILPPDLFQMLSRYLQFRNFFIYQYIFEIRWEDLKILVETISEVTVRLRSEVEEYIQTI
jgi:uncharacterized protein YutE (UPF0331/DUF86 family)